MSGPGWIRVERIREAARCTGSTMAGASSRSPTLRPARLAATSARPAPTPARSPSSSPGTWMPKSASAAAPARMASLNRLVVR
jgi:hypothetical protein